MTQQDGYVFTVSSVEEGPSFIHVEGEDSALMPRRISIDVDLGRRISVGSKLTVRAEFEAPSGDADKD